MRGPTERLMVFDDEFERDEYSVSVIIDFGDLRAIIRGLTAAQEYADADRALKVICEANSAAYRERWHVEENAQVLEDVAEQRWVKARDAYMAAFEED